MYIPRAFSNPVISGAFVVVSLLLLGLVAIPGVGVYLNEAGKVPLLEVVEEAERRMTNRHQPRTYMPMSGLPAYCQAVQKLVFGKDHPAVAAGTIATVQTLGGTGALQLGAAFAHQGPNQ